MQLQFRQEGFPPRLPQLVDGWPDYSYGRNNDSSPLPSPRNVPGIEPALLVWVPGITPSGLLFYTADRFPAWKGNLMVGSVVRGRTNGASGVEPVVFNTRSRGLFRRVDPMDPA